MQFVQNGPDVPNGLLHAHEEGKVVFFCGAGISMRAGLPDFRTLTCRVFKEVELTMNEDEQNAFKAGRYDAVFSLLEARHVEERRGIRRTVCNILTPKRLTKAMKATHAALLDLARDRKGSTRIVTTNFDHVFERCSAKGMKQRKVYEAPFLPIPKRSRWDGIVHLHGRLPSHKDQDLLDRLVLSSGDFGLAYLVERWASRFVTELLQNWTVCFVGYGINDPVMRYLTDAVAADRSMGETTSPAYAFVAAAPGEEDQVRRKWTETRGIHPVIYSDRSSHRALHETLRVWSEAWRDGIEGKERIIDQCVFLNPSQSTAEDDFVGRVMWALEDPSAVPAKRFAELDPAPHISWLDELGRPRFDDDDLPRFGIAATEHEAPKHAKEKKLRFSFFSRPSSYRHAPWMRIVQHSWPNQHWDGVMFQLARWLVRHIDDERILLWIAEQGNRLDDQFIRLIRDQLYRPMRSSGQPSNDRADQPAECSLMRRAWKLAIEDRLWRGDVRGDIFDWRRRLKLSQSDVGDRGGSITLDTSLRFELRRLLSPRLKIRRRLSAFQRDENEERADVVGHPVSFEVVLTTQHVKDVLSENIVQQVLPQLIDDLEGLLVDALDLLHDVELADQNDDRSWWDLPSIEPHSQNHGTWEWVALIEVVRDAWLGVVKSDPSAAAERARGWWRRPYPTFKRLALFAAAHCTEVSAKEWAGWIAMDDGFWIWSECTKRELCRLFVARGKELRLNECRTIEKIILAGPPEDCGE